MFSMSDNTVHTLQYRSRQIKSKKTFFNYYTFFLMISSNIIKLDKLKFEKKGLHDMKNTYSFMIFVCGL